MSSKKHHNDSSSAHSDHAAYLLHSAHPSPNNMGTVYLVGGGPGDPELLTIRAANLIAAADAIVYDHLIGEGVLDFARQDAEKHYVGKEAGTHTLPQEDINLLLVRLAEKGLKVVRLKGGDPFIFGRGGEEILELARRGVPFEVVPGVTAASGMAAYAGIPLTHRNFAQSCIFTTGHLKDGSCNLDWHMLVRPDQTVVIYMGVGALPEISRQLIAHGMPTETPAAIVQNATLERQRTIVGTVSNLPERAKEAGLKPPSIIILGKVVQLAVELNWFEKVHTDRTG